MRFFLRVLVAPLVSRACYAAAWAVVLVLWAAASGLLVLAAYLLAPGPYWQLSAVPAALAGLALAVVVAHGHGGAVAHDKARPGSRALGTKRRGV